MNAFSIHGRAQSEGVHPVIPASILYHGPHHATRFLLPVHALLLAAAGASCCSTLVDNSNNAPSGVLLSRTARRPIRRKPHCPIHLFLES